MRKLIIGTIAAALLLLAAPAQANQFDNNFVGLYKGTTRLVRGVRFCDDKFPIRWSIRQPDWNTPYRYLANKARPHYRMELDLRNGLWVGWAPQSFGIRYISIDYRSRSDSFVGTMTNRFDGGGRCQWKVSASL